MKIIDEYDSNKYIEVKKEYIHAKGGDGTLLKAIQMFKNKGLPFFGEAAGTENFLMNPAGSSPKKFSYPQKFNLIKAKITYMNLERDLSSIDDHYVEREKEIQAFNDIMIGGDMNSWINFSIQDENNIFGDFKGGGIIISTSQGSTGINKNNGGVIMPLSSNNWSITGDKTNRKINYVVEPKKIIIECNSRNEIVLWGDGSNNIIKNIKRVEITKGDEVTLLFNDYKSFQRKRRI